MTSLITEALKKMLGDRRYSPNILAAIVAVITAGGICRCHRGADMVMCNAWV